MNNFLLTYTNDDYVPVLCVDFNAYTLTLLDFCSNVDDDQVTAEIPYTNLSDYGLPADRANQDDRHSNGRKTVEICKNNKVFILNGRLGEACGVCKPNTAYHTTINYS